MMRMEYTATAKYVRMAPRKVRLVARAVRGMQAAGAVAVLKMTPKYAAGPIVKVINSAIANAKIKNAKADGLAIGSIDVMEGPVMKRWHAVSRGTAHGYKKRMSHVKVVLTEVTEKKAKESERERKGG